MEFVSKMLSHMASQFGDMELYTSIVIGVLILVWAVGSIANRSIANAAYRRFVPTLATQFSVPGALSKESNSHYFVYSTGRSRCSGQVLSLKLSPRNDLIARYVLSWFWKTMYAPDRVIVGIFDAEIDSSITAFVCRKYQAEKLVEGEVKKFSKSQNGVIEGGDWAKYSSSSLTGFTYICDAGGKAVAPAVFGRGSNVRVPEWILKNVESVLVSGSTKSVKIELTAIPREANEWKDLVDYVLFGLLDQLAAVRVSDAVRSEVATQRAADAERAARDAEEAKRKEELQKQKGTLSAEEREKLEEKRKKKEQRKNLRSGRIML
jgi:hypothetical protein